jgi:hypothetical protein
MYVCDIDEMMDIEARRVRKKDNIRTWEPYFFHRLWIASILIVMIWQYPCARASSKMMDHSRDCVAMKGMPDPRG